MPPFTPLQKPRSLSSKLASQTNWLLALAMAFTLMNVVLRIGLLIRPTPYGAPYVENFERYIFHAIAYDILWSLVFFIPFGILLSLFAIKNIALACKIVRVLMVSILMTVLVLNIIDHELMRHMSFHISIGFMRSYINMSSARDFTALVGSDHGGFMTLFILNVGVPLMFLLFCFFAAPRIRFTQKQRNTTVVVLMLMVAISYVLLFVFWSGHFRKLRLRPATASLWLGILEQKVPEPPAEEIKEHNLNVQELWKSLDEDNWEFPSIDYPFYRQSKHYFCANNKDMPRCQLDQDGDGFFAFEDCDDHSPSINPSQKDIPSNGIDEDCSGVDEAPWNVVVIMLESHRSDNIGHLKEFGATSSDSPFLDTLANEGRTFVRHYGNGVPTIQGFFSMHCSLPSKGPGYIATEHTDINIKCLPDILSARGYETYAFPTSHPDWDNKTFWLAKWYDSYFYDQSRETDLSMFKFMGDWMKKEIDPQKPFFVYAISKTNHSPFKSVHDMTDQEKQNTPDDIGTTMQYADRSLKAFFEKIKDETWFSKTLFIVTADHGINTGEHGAWSMGDPLKRQSTWLPLVVYGEHPKLTSLPKINHSLSSHIDIAPTVLDVLGIQDENAFAGHSLLEPKVRKNNYVFAAHPYEIAFEQGAFRSYFGHPPNTPRKDGKQLFDSKTDFRLISPLNLTLHSELLQSHQTTSNSLFISLKNALLKNRIFREKSAH